MKAILMMTVMQEFEVPFGPNDDARFCEIVKDSVSTYMGRIPSIPFRIADGGNILDFNIKHVGWASMDPPNPTLHPPGCSAAEPR